MVLSPITLYSNSAKVLTTSLYPTGDVIGATVYRKTGINVPDADIFGFLRPRVDLRSGIRTEHFPTLAFCGIRREAAQKISDSGILLDKRFEDSYYDQDSHEGMKTGEHLSIASWILFDAAKELGLSIAHHPELFLKWREAVPESEWHKWAVVNVESSPWGKAGNRKQGTGGKMPDRCSNRCSKTIRK